MTPDGYGSDFFSDPSVLIRELDHVQAGTLFLLRQRESLGIKVESGIANVNELLAQVDVDLDEMTAKQSEVPPIELFSEAVTASDAKRAEETDSELARLRVMIAKVHEKCFAVGGGTMPALLMLERIETGLENLYARLAKVSPAFAEAKQKKKDAERLEQYKVAVAERKAAEQKLKIDAAIERAQMPIVRRTGRPPVKRMLPIAVVQKDPERSRAERRERERIGRLLYGRDGID
jgi:hypothetical protein